MHKIQAVLWKGHSYETKSHQEFRNIWRKIQKHPWAQHIETTLFTLLVACGFLASCLYILFNICEDPGRKAGTKLFSQRKFNIENWLNRSWRIDKAKRGNWGNTEPVVVGNSYHSLGEWGREGKGVRWSENRVILEGGGLWGAGTQVPEALRWHRRLVLETQREAGNKASAASTAGAGRNRQHTGGSMALFLLQPSHLPLLPPGGRT